MYAIYTNLSLLCAPFSPSKLPKHSPSPSQLAHCEAVPAPAPAAVAMSNTTAAATALCLLTTHIAHEVVAGISAGTVSLPGESLVQQLLQHVWLLGNKVDGQLTHLQEENVHLKQHAAQTGAQYAELLDKLQQKPTAIAGQKLKFPAAAAGAAAAGAGAGAGAEEEAVVTQAHVQFSPDVKAGKYSDVNSQTSTPIDDYKTFMRTMAAAPTPLPVCDEKADAAADDAAAADDNNNDNNNNNGASTEHTAAVAVIASPLQLFEASPAASPAAEQQTHKTGVAVAEAGTGTGTGTSSSTSTAHPSTSSASRSGSPAPHARYSHVQSPVRAYISGSTTPTSAEARSHLHPASTPASAEPFPRGRSTTATTTSGSRARSSSNPREMSRFELPAYIPTTPVPTILSSSKRNVAGTTESASVGRNMHGTQGMATASTAVAATPVQSPKGPPRHTHTHAPSPSSATNTGHSPNLAALHTYGSVKHTPTRTGTGCSKQAATMRKSPSSDSVINSVNEANQAISACVDMSAGTPTHVRYVHTWHT